jgi:colanic acid/amylovoran biosynthesis glycosyltransferase
VRDAMSSARQAGVLSVCVARPNEFAYSETFIQAHLDRLPAHVTALHGGGLPMQREDGRPILSPNLGARVFRAAARRLLKLSTSHFETRALARFLAKNGIEVVLAEYGPTGVAMLDSCARAAVPLVVHFHGFDAYHRPTLQTYGHAYRRLFGAAAAVVAVSRDMEKALLSLGARRERLFYNPYGVDTSFFAGGNPNAAGPVFVAIGRFVEKKAPHLVVLAFAEAWKACPAARLIMVGDGPLLGATQHLARALDVAGAIEFLGARHHSEVPAIMRNARAFVQHSVIAADGDAEGTPVAVLEAGAAGLPVVATRHGGIPDAVVSGETGLLVDEGDVSAMATCMVQLAKDPQLAFRLGSAARDRICAEFSMEKATRALLRILEDARSSRER